MHLRSAPVPLSILLLISYFAAASVLAQDADSDGGASDDAGIGAESIDAGAPEAGVAEDAGAEDDAGGAGDALDAGAALDALDAGGAPHAAGLGDAGGKVTHPGAGEENEALIDTYTDDHGCSCSMVGHSHELSGGLSSLAFAAALIARAWRRRQKRPVARG